MLMKKSIAFAAAAVAVGMFGMSQAVQASSVTTTFDAGGYAYSTSADSDASATIVADPTSTGHGNVAQLSSTDGQGTGKIILDFAPGQLTLRNAIGSFDYYNVTAGHDLEHNWPYMYFYVDTNKSNTLSYPDDSFLIGINFVGSAPIGKWTHLDFNGSSAIHVVGNTDNLAANSINANNTTLSSLYNVPLTGGGTWGDLNVLQVRVAFGTTSVHGDPVKAYVDNVNVANVVPLPAALPAGLALLGLCGAGMLVRRQRRAA